MFIKESTRVSYIICNLRTAEMILWGGSLEPGNGHRLFLTLDLFLLCAAALAAVVVVSRVKPRSSASIK